MTNIHQMMSALKEKGLYREDFKHLSSEQAHKVEMEGKETILLGSNNYLGLCSDIRLKEAAIDATVKYGVGSGGSRLTTGSYDLHRALERKIADFKGTQASLIFNTGYMANVGVISSLCDRKWAIFSDKNNHASIVDGCLLNGSRLVRYKHCDMGDLERKIIEHRGSSNLIVTDGVFSMDGDVAPLDCIVKLAKKYGAITMVDDAHGVGVLGEKGSGTVSHFRVDDEIDIQMGTLSKAIGSIGGYVAGKQCFIDYFRNFARSFIYSTSLPPASIAASLKAIEIIENEDSKRVHLLKMANGFKNKLTDAGFIVSDTITPIIPVIIGDAQKAVEISKSLLQEGIFIPAIRPPTVSNGTSRLRLSLMATHTDYELEYVFDKLVFHAKRLGVIEG
ncbi:8-amino-7-oxononanoate synthase [Peptoclostridium litorale DSM 5388]|uniref:8-amino-7-ketopelargonate synthase n=1 Tax=Peptoclostridium litorale DSM 5388 TaxID=1121324 RepID=A0A069RI31_PEPLI|nr:8-amino-7-oxononanoate synthase [Peptoclostridium litorale]KDR96636.1 putative 8-amino-7-oxononanoate synthase BioF [Peptoclostridium litorale DSM 5388]SIN68218.1 8-amino-7-oxononanoate synthase [Peptoclostridium litorale DSM 5388]